MLELGGILILGVLAQWVAWRIKLPAILPLILIGLFVGPVSEFLFDGKFVDPEHIFQEKAFFWFVSLSVGIILFEGGLTLKFKEVREHGRTLTNIIFIGTIVMSVGGGLAAWLILDLNWRLALLFGSLIIVTGPTVIAPLLKTVKPNKKIATILKWEGILIDPVGALVAVLVYELLFVAMSGHGDANFTLIALKTFSLVIFVGSVVGLVLGYLLYWLLKKELIPKNLLEVVVLAFVILAFAGSDFFVHESGLLAVTVMGILLANLDTPKIKQIIHFKESITVLLISILFIILSAKINIADIQLLDIRTLWIFLIVVFILRPIAVFLSGYKSKLSFNEKAFISFIGPKGIVAAAVASLFSLYLSDPEHVTLSAEVSEQVKLLVPLTFAIILGTVTLNGLTAKPVAKLLDVVMKDSKGYLIAGANDLGVAIANYLRSNDLNVLLVDTSESNVKKAIKQGLNSIQLSIISDDIDEVLETEDVGNLLALTAANDVNIFAITKFIEIFKEDNVYRLVTPNESSLAKGERPRNILFGVYASYFKLTQILRRFPEMNEYNVKSKEQLKNILVDEDDGIIPIFIRKKNGKIIPINAKFDQLFDDGDILAYIGNPKEMEKFAV